MVNKRAKIRRHKSWPGKPTAYWWLNIVGGNGQVQAATEQFSTLSNAKRADKDLELSMVEILEDRGYLIGPRTWATTETSAAEYFHPGEYIREEMEARNMTEADLALALRLSPIKMRRLLRGERPITPFDAVALWDAWGTSPEFWMNLQRSYDKSKRIEPEVYKL